MDEEKEWKEREEDEDGPESLCIGDIYVRGRITSP